MEFFSFLGHKKLISELQAEVENLKRQTELVITKEKYVEEHSDIDSISDISTNIFSYVYESKDGWRYEILKNEHPFIKQDYWPNKEGFVPMTQEEATKLSNEIVACMRETENANNQ